MWVERTGQCTGSRPAVLRIDTNRRWEQELVLLVLLLVSPCIPEPLGAVANDSVRVGQDSTTVYFVGVRR